MLDSITFDDFTKLPNIIISNSKELEYTQLLSESTINAYYYIDLKKDLLHLFKKFCDAKYILELSDDYGLKSNSFSLEINKATNLNNDKVGNYVGKKIDLNIWSKDFYNILLSVCDNLTLQESVYLVSTFFENKTEEYISEKLGICRTTLQKIKKSCLVKLLLLFTQKGLL